MTANFIVAFVSVRPGKQRGNTPDLFSYSRGRKANFIKANFIEVIIHIKIALVKYRATFTLDYEQIKD